MIKSKKLLSLRTMIVIIAITIFLSLFAIFITWLKADASPDKQATNGTTISGEIDIYLNSEVKPGPVAGWQISSNIDSLATNTHLEILESGTLLPVDTIERGKSYIVNIDYEVNNSPTDLFAHDESDYYPDDVFLIDSTNNKYIDEVKSVGYYYNKPEVVWQGSPWSVIRSVFGISLPLTCDIKIGICQNGSISASSESAAPGDVVTLKATPDAGYKFSKWITTPADLVINEDGTFIMPDGDVSISAEFVEAAVPDNPAVAEASADAAPQTGDFATQATIACLVIIALAGSFALRRKFN